MRRLKRIEDLGKPIITVVNAEYPGSERPATAEDLKPIEDARRAYHAGCLYINGRLVLPADQEEG